MAILFILIASLILTLGIILKLQPLIIILIIIIMLRALTICLGGVR
jgi:hypothetical protein